MSELNKAIAYMCYARKIHQEWADYFTAHPEQQKVFKDTVHGRKRQLKIVAEYDRVIRLLEGRTPSANTAETDGECENCPSESFTTSCVDCGCNLCDKCKIELEGRTYCTLCNEKYFD